MDDNIVCDCISVLETPTQHYGVCETVLKDLLKSGKIPNLPRNREGRLLQINPHLETLSEDLLYHLALGNRSHDLRTLFQDVKFVCMGGTAYRMHTFAKRVARELKMDEDKLEDLSAASHRYSVYKVGPVLSVNHGIGMASLNVVLQEVLKLIQYAGATDPIFIRVGTSGGLGVAPGTVVVSKRAFNGLLNETYDLAILGEMVSLPATPDQKLAEELSMMTSPDDDFQITCGGTFSAEDFYQGQCRLDGPFCGYSADDKTAFLDRLRRRGVLNMEMETTAFTAWTKMAGVKSTSVCVTLIDRSVGDQVEIPKKLILEWQERPMTVVIRYIKKYLEKIET